MTFRFGKPKDTFERPSTVFTPTSSRSLLTVCAVIFAFCLSTLTAIVRASIIIFSLSMPYFCALSTIRFAMSIRSSTVCGTPLSSRQSPMTYAPYFFASGKTLSILACSPLTELMIGKPTVCLKPCSKAVFLLVSRASGKSVTACTASTAFVRQTVSSMPPIPTFTSRISAPSSIWSTAIDTI